MAAMRIFRAAITVLGIGLAGPGHASDTPLPDLLPTDVTRITYRAMDIVPFESTVVNPDSIATILSLMELTPKERCECMHNEYLDLEHADGVIECSICSHCLDMSVPGDGVFRFAMPDTLWRLLLQIHGR